MASYLITGGCGFIGSHLADALLARGDTVRILDNLSTGKRSNVSADCEIIVGDIAVDGVVAKAMEGMDGCWHLAAVASVMRANEAWVETHRSNLTGSIQVFDAARNLEKGGPIPVVYASSAAVYGDNPAVPLQESAVLTPMTAYGADKLGSELHARVATMIHGVPTVGFRFFNVYGLRQDPSSPYSGVISIFSDKIARKQPITVFGDGSQTRDFVHVSDIVRFLLAAMGRGVKEPEVYNVATGRETSILQLAQTLFAVSNSQVPINFAKKRQGDISVSLGSPEKGVEQLGLRATMLLKDGLEQLLAG